MHPVIMRQLAADRIKEECRRPRPKNGGRITPAEPGGEQRLRD